VEFRKKLNRELNFIRRPLDWHLEKLFKLIGTFLRWDQWIQDRMEKNSLGWDYITSIKYLVLI